MDRHIDMRMGMCIDICTDMCINMCIDMSIDMCRGMFSRTYGLASYIGDECAEFAKGEILEARRDLLHK